LFGAQFDELKIYIYKITQETLAQKSSFDRVAPLQLINNLTGKILIIFILKEH